MLSELRDITLSTITHREGSEGLASWASPADANISPGWAEPFDQRDHYPFAGSSRVAFPMIRRVS